MKTLNTTGVHRKIQFLGGGLAINQYIGRNYPKRGGLGQFADLRGGGGWLGEKERVVFLKGGVDTQCTLWVSINSFSENFVHVLNE